MNGFERAKIGDIAQNAGVAKGSMYQYFKDKKELFVYCAEWGLDTFMKKLDQRMNMDSMDIFKYFEDNAANTAKFELIKEEGELVAFMQLIEREPGLIAPSMKAMNKAGELYTKRLIKASQDLGLVRTDIDEELLLEYFLAVTGRFEERWMGRYIDFTKEATEEQTRALNAELKQMLALLRNGMGC
jgi:AcrR family transcriptional regulator